MRRRLAEESLLLTRSEMFKAGNMAETVNAAAPAVERRSHFPLRREIVERKLIASRNVVARQETRRTWIDLEVWIAAVIQIFPGSAPRCGSSIAAVVRLEVAVYADLNGVPRRSRTYAPRQTEYLVTAIKSARRVNSGRPGVCPHL